MLVICVDDEKLVLQLTVTMCQELTQITDVKGFTQAKEALLWLDTHKADIALLDINMPNMDGIALAAKMKEKCPDISIIFLTAYAKYAVEAFALHVSGYLLKPINRERLSAEIDYAIKNRAMRFIQSSSQNSPVKPPHIMVKTFGNFDILVDGKVVAFPRSKSKELLAYLVDKQGSSITRAEAFALLWEDGMYDRSMQKQLDVIIRCLRSTLKEYGISEVLEMQRGSLRICPEQFDCDLYRFFNGDINAINSYRGEYMSSYSWASLTEAYMDRINKIN